MNEQWMQPLGDDGLVGLAQAQPRHSLHPGYSRRKEHQSSGLAGVDSAGLDVGL